MSRIRVTPQAAAEIALLRERLRESNMIIRRLIEAGNALAVYAPQHEVKRWKAAKGFPE